MATQTPSAAYRSAKASTDFLPAARTCPEKSLNDRRVSIAINQRGGFEMEGSSGKSLSYIVGGSSGMGLATARLLVADGGTVVLVAREQDKLAARKGELEAGGRGKVETITADFYDAGAVKSLIAKIDGETRHINQPCQRGRLFYSQEFP